MKKHEADLMTNTSLQMMASGFYLENESDWLHKSKSNPQRYLDDHHSPLKPHPYIMLRMRPEVLRLRVKIPIFSRLRFFFQMCLFAAVAGATVASYYAVEYVAIISSFAAGITSWVAYSELDSRLNFYTTTVRELNKLSSWWADHAPTKCTSSLGLASPSLCTECRVLSLIATCRMPRAVHAANRWDSMKDSEKALPANISLLVLSCEGIITKDAMSITDQLAAGPDAADEEEEAAPAGSQ